MQTRSQHLHALERRLARLGIQVKFVGNIPWIYLYSVNGIRVTETFESNYGFTVAFMDYRDGVIRMHNLRATFRLIRRYLQPGN